MKANKSFIKAPFVLSVFVLNFVFGIWIAKGIWSYLTKKLIEAKSSDALYLVNIIFQNGLVFALLFSVIITNFILTIYLVLKRNN